MNKIQRTIFDQSVSDRIERLLARCEGVKLARDLDRPHVFDAAGQRHAASVAQRDRRQENN